MRKRDGGLKKVQEVYRLNAITARQHLRYFVKELQRENPRLSEERALEHLFQLLSKQSI